MLKTPGSVAILTPEEGSKRRLPLQSGDRLTRPEFERRYEMHPELKKAELIEGVVYVTSPVYLEHSLLHANVIGWLFNYRVGTPGLLLGDNLSVRLDPDNEVQPDAALWIETELVHHRPLAGEKIMLEQAPELIVEVAVSSASYDLHDKLHVYRRNGVQEYVVALALEQEIRWFIWDEGQYEQLRPDEAGIFRSLTFPGLWLDENAFWANDMAQVLETLRAGMASEAYLEFRQQLAAQLDS